MDGERQQVEADRPQVEVDLGRHGQTLLAALAGGPLSRAGAMAAIGFKNEYRSYQRHLVPLIDLGLVGMTNPDNPTAHNQTYALTGSGRSVLVALRETALSEDQS